MKLIFVAGVLAIASVSSATITQVGSGAAMGADDGINWSQFGGEFTEIASGTHGVTNNGIGFTLVSVDNNGVDDGSKYQIRVQGTSWNGVFNTGATVLWHEGSSNTHSSLGIVFDQQVAGIGSFVTSNAFGDFQALAGYWTAAFPSTALGVTGVTGTMAPGPAGTAPYMGGLSDSTNLGAYYLYTSMLTGGDDFGFAVTNMDVRDGAAVPEPASMAALALGIGALIRRRKNAK